MKIQVKCPCGVCLFQNTRTVIKGQSISDAPQLTFCELLKKLVNINSGIRIPETVYFKDGEVKHVFYTQGDMIKEIKSKINVMQVRAFMNERRKTPAEDKRKVEAVILYYLDGNTQVMTESEFLNLMVKRKEDPFWQHIGCLQNYIKCQNYKLTYSIYVYSLKSEHYARALKYAQQVVDETSNKSPNYISIIEEKAYEMSLGTELLKYLNTKLCLFLELSKSIRILQCRFEYILNDQYQWILLGVTDCLYQQLPEFQIEKSDASNYDLYMHLPMPEKANYAIVKSIEQAMEDHYIQEKIKLGFRRKVLSKDVELECDQAFKLFYPNRKINYDRQRSKFIPSSTKMFDMFQKSKIFATTSRNNQSLSIRQDKTPQRFFTPSIVRKAEMKMYKNSLGSILY